MKIPREENNPYTIQMFLLVLVGNFKALGKNGVAIVVIEKEGIPQVLASHAAEYGVALVNTRGRLTRDGIAFIEEIKKLGSIVTLFVDYAAVGQDMIKSDKDQNTCYWRR